MACLNVGRENLVSRTDRANAEYQAFADSVLKFSYDSSRSGTKMQMKPIRSALLWKLPMESGSKMQSVPIRNARNWLIRTDLNTMKAEVGGVVSNQQVAVLETPLSSLQILLIGIGIGWIGKEFLGK